MSSLPPLVVESPIPAVTYFLFDETGGEYQYRTVVCDPQFLANCVPPGMVGVPESEVGVNAHAKLFLNGELVDAPRPPQPDVDHEWNDQAQRWTLTPAAVMRIRDDKEARDRIALVERASLRALRELALGDKTALTRLRTIDEEIVAARRRMSGGNETRKHSDIGAANE